MNFFHHCKLSGHWEEKCWWLHLELHPRNCTTKRRVWRVKKERGEEIHVSPIKGEDVSQRVVAVQEVILNNEASSCLMEWRESGEGSQAWDDISFIAHWLNNDFQWMDQLLQVE
jgi:hypothetical protein